jgi:exodeoxyribonuclease III
MRIATYNINGVKARMPRLIEWLNETQPAAACLQEVKSEDGDGPLAEIAAATGYHGLWHGQKGFNGVAILAPAGTEIIEAQRGLPGDPEDEQARYIEADVAGVRIASLYLPNGNPHPGPKFDYKLAWMDRLRARGQALLAREIPTILAGDYNVIPHDDDVFSPPAMASDALMQPESRAAYRRILADGWSDALRSHHPSGGIWTYWDYQAGAWPRDAGFRIDHLLLSPQAADRLQRCGVDKDHRGREKASDHAATWVELSV